jgi:hypothetical protein
MIAGEQEGSPVQRRVPALDELDVPDPLALSHRILLTATPMAQVLGQGSCLSQQTHRQGSHVQSKDQEVRVR